MKASTKVLAALLAAASLATPAVAEEKFELSGGLRVQGFTIDKDAADADSYFAQRLRLNGTFNAAPGVKAVFAADVAEGTWGENGNESIRNKSGKNGTGNIQWNAAYLEIDQAAYTLRAGQQLFASANYLVVDSPETGFSATIKGEVPVTVFYAKIDENGTDENATTDESKNESADENLFGAIVAHKGANYEAQLFYARLESLVFDDNDAAGNNITVPGRKANAIGVAYNGTHGSISINTEVDYLFGTYNSVDLFGTQAFIDVASQLNEGTKVGVTGFFALGDDKDQQIVNLGDDGDWTPDTYGYLTGDYSLLPSGSWEVYSFAGNSSGVLGGQLYADYAINSDLGLMAALMYLTPQEDKNTLVDDYLGANISAQYALAQNATFALQATFAQTQDATTGDDVDPYAIAAQIAVNF